METRETLGCSLPPPLTEDEVSSAVDGHPSRHVRAHLRRCTFCSDRVVRAKHFETSLSTALYRFNCPPAHQLGDFVFGLLESYEAQELTDHLVGCVRCATELSELRTLLNAESSQDHAVIQKRELTDLARSGIPFPRIRFDEIIARLLPRAPGLALRGTSLAVEPLVAEAGDTVISLDVQPATGGKVMVTGMLSASELEPWIGALAVLSVGDESQVAATVDENGGFAFESVPAGRATLRITPEQGSRIALTDLELA